MSNQIEGSSIAILIDCWKDCNPAIIKNITQFCVDNSSIKTIILSSYVEDQSLSIDEPYWSNSNNIFNKETKFDELRQQWNSSDFQTQSNTHENLLESWSRPDQLLLAAFSSLQILYYCNYVNPSVDKIYFFGQSWDICVKFRSTGWLQINALNYHDMFKTKKILLSRPECVAFKSEISSSFDSAWSKLPNGDYQLTKDIWQ